MKINYNNYPILEKLNKGSLGTIPLFEEDSVVLVPHMPLLTTIWKAHVLEFRDSINYISKPFSSASEAARPKLLGLLNDILAEDICDLTIKGTYIYGDYVYMIDYSVKKGVETQELIFYMFSKEGTPLACLIDSAKHNIYLLRYVSSVFNIEKSESGANEWLFHKTTYILIDCMFKQYAQVETKIIKGNSKQKIGKEKYLNETKLDITYLDSKWFTTLVKSNRFKVRGHFRLQPKKQNGNWTRELIWIDDFEKSGYTAPARKLSTL
jgi:hypothetical protein